MIKVVEFLSLFPLESIADDVEAFISSSLAQGDLAGKEQIQAPNFLPQLRLTSTLHRSSVLGC